MYLTVRVDTAGAADTEGRTCPRKATDITTKVSSQFINFKFYKLNMKYFPLVLINKL